MPPPNKPDAPKPNDVSSAEGPKVEGPKVEETKPDQSAELKKVTAERDALKATHARTQLTIRKLAAAIVTPPDEADRGVARSQSIRQNLLALVEVIAPE